ncbi:unnamed protein product, partial [Effrenium voratum]
LPAGLWLGYNSDGFGREHFMYQKHGFPIQCFGPRCCVYPYMGLHMLDSLLQMRGFLIGTTNRIFLDRTVPDVVLEVPGTESNKFSVEFRCKELKELTRCTSCERSWLQDACARLGAAMPEPEAPPLRRGREKRRQATLGGCQPSGSEKVMHKATSLRQDVDEPPVVPVVPVMPEPAEEDEDELIAALPEIAAVVRISSEELVRDVQTAEAFGVIVAKDGEAGCMEAGSSDSRARSTGIYLALAAHEAAVVDADRTAFIAYWRRLVAAAKIAGLQRDLAQGLEAATRQEKSELGRFGLPFLQRWVRYTHGGRTWLQVHKLPVTEKRPKPPREGPGTYIFSNGDEYHGEFRRSMRHGSGLYVSHRNHMQYDGQWYRDRRHGTGTLTIEGAGKVLYTYDGQWQADKRHGSGSCVRCHKEKYSGQWMQNLYHGAGTYVDEKGSLYEGEWYAGKFHGVGKHVCNGETYTGSFVAGERHGMGQLAKSSESLEGIEDFLGLESLYAGQWSSP